jgi:protein phosphatase 1B
MTKELKSSNGEITDRVEALLETGVKAGFLALDAEMREKSDMHGDDRSGTTAICALITPTHIFLANLGNQNHAKKMTLT